MGGLRGALPRSGPRTQEPPRRQRRRGGDVSTEIEGTSATASTPQKFTAPSRIFHWLTAILIFAPLFIGFTMVNWLAGYAALRGIHMPLGALIPLGATPP